MDQHNKLLAMLKSATSPPPPSSASPFEAVNASGTINQTQSNGESSRDHIFTSPPPPQQNTQAVSLLDLFKNISSPPPPSAQSLEGTNLQQEGNQQNRLLGMLNSIGQGQSTPNAGVISPNERSTAATPVNAQGEKSDPLAVFRASHPNLSPSAADQGPINNHPSGITSPSAKLLPPPTVQAQHTGTSTTSTSQAKSAVKAADEKPSTAAVPAITANETPKKSMFHFDSPFDAFEQLPKSRQPSSSNVKPPKKEKNATPKDTKAKLEDEQKLNKVKSIDKLPLAGNGRTISQGSSTSLSFAEPALKAEREPYEPPMTFTTPVSINELPQTEIDDKIQNTWQHAKVVKDAQGKGPKGLTSNTSIVLSQPNLDLLVNTGDPVQITPTTLMRTDFMTFKKGRRVGITKNFIAYTMSKGRIRLIDSTSGARAVIQQFGTATMGPVTDLAVTANLIASIGWDKTIAVHKVPSAGWQTDDPNIELVFYAAVVNSPTGWPTKIEWVKKDGKDWLAVAGTEGVVVFDPLAYGRGGRLLGFEDICKDNKMLKTDGNVVDFCLNATQQAIGLLSSDSYLTLYNVSNLNRVWHRSLPSKAPEKEPSSIQFCESNILVGRAKNSHYDLVQITVDLAVLSTIEFVAPPPCLEDLNYSHAVYDSNKTTLYIAPFARGSLYAFKYALKGQQPIKDASKPDGPKVAAFDKAAEYPLQPVTSLVLAKKGIEEDSEIFFATPQGLSQATISRSAYNALKAPIPAPTAGAPQQSESTASVPALTPAPPAVPAASTTKAVPSPNKGGKIELPKPRSRAGSKAPSKNASPTVVKAELPSASEDEAPAPVRPKAQSRKGSIAAIAAANSAGEELNGSAAGQEDFTKALKKTEDRLSNHLKQLLKNEIAALNSRFDGLTGPDFATDISARVERSIKGSLNNTIVQEIKKTLVPAATSTIQNEVRTVTSNQVPAAIFDALQTVPKELERSLVPIVQRTISNLVSNAMDKAVQEAIQHTLLPAMTQASSSVVESLSAEMRSEMLQIRKELSPPSNEGQLANDHLIRNMSTSIAELQKQVTSLSEHLKSNPPPSAPNGVVSPPQAPVSSNNSNSVAPPPPHHPLPPVQQQQQQQAPPHFQPPTPSQLEDTFLTALGVQTTASTLQLVAEHLFLTEYCLPTQGKSPLSQAVLLTLLHRLSIVLTELPSTNPMFIQVAGWSRRTAILVDPKDQNIAGYISRVLSVVQGQLNAVMNNLQRFPDQNTQSHTAMMRGIMDIIGHKMNA
ncbi:uncharacterized protein L201_006848 [Kwoniella dendrophila CBS 6074]|uniref:Enhancer of mRNA-decapping protein 4 WD40 repeat region domain-containing protein n=1 Tax=Kwoniella dendrophila CBS 6074 TaxID=1295534 RepID=A0AAX4K460_9TREE